MLKRLLFIFIALSIVLLIYLFDLPPLSSIRNQIPSASWSETAEISAEEKDSITTENFIDAEDKIQLYGLAIAGDSVSHHYIKKGDTFIGIFYEHFGEKPFYITQKALEFHFPISELKAGMPYSISYKKGMAHGFYILKEEQLIGIRSLFTVSNRALPYQEKQTALEGTLKNSLWQLFSESDHSVDLAIRLERVFEHQIDFYRLQKNDEITVFFTEKIRADGKRRIQDVHFAQIKHKGTLYQAMYFDSKNGASFYNEKGESLKSAFLRSPLEYGRLTSGYNPRRFHPVLKTIRAHKGTDYAAPHGTPIRSVADGVVIKASRSAGNGNYVKIRHNKNVDTQYLHMSRFARGIKAGKRVSKGQTIGYVGSTGLATGPHVCFRYWLNGKQVNHLAIKAEPSTPIDPSEQEEYKALFELTKEKMAEMLVKI